MINTKGLIFQFSLRSLTRPCHRQDTRVTFVPANSYLGEKIKASSHIPQAARQYRINGATMTSNLMGRLTGGLPAMLFVVLVSTGAAQINKGLADVGTGDRPIFSSHLTVPLRDPERKKGGKRKKDLHPQHNT